MNFKIGLKSLVTNHGDLRAVSAGATSLLCFLRKRSAIPISGYPAGWRSPTVAIHHAANERAVANSHGMPLFSLGSSGNSQACLLLVLRAGISTVMCTSLADV
jgi:hypothetical protein